MFILRIYISCYLRDRFPGIGHIMQPLHCSSYLVCDLSMMDSRTKEGEILNSCRDVFLVIRLLGWYCAFYSIIRNDVCFLVCVASHVV